MQRIFAFSETSPAAPGTVASSQAVTGSDPSAPAGVLLGPQNFGLDQFQAIAVLAQLVGATGGTLDVYIQTSIDQGVSWMDYAHFPQLAAGAAAVRYAFQVSGSGQLLTPVVVGMGLAPALVANTVVGSAWGDRMRLVMVAGTGTTVGAAVSIKVSGQRPL